MQKFKVILAVTIALGTSTAAQSATELLYNPDWGIGIIGPARSETLSFPDKAITLYDAPFGNKKYVLWEINNYYLVFGSEKEMSDKTVPSGIVNGKDWIEVTKGGACLKYYQQRGSYFLILIYSSFQEFWISSSELQKVNFYVIDWMSFLLAKKTGFYPATEKGLVLREEPNPKSKGVIWLKNINYLITLSGKTEGQWAEVKVTWPRFGLGGKEVAKSRTYYKGWIKMLDDDGSPNIWFYTRD